MVGHHKSSMFKFNSCRISTLSYTKNELSLSSIHNRIESSRIHSEWIKILFFTNISIPSNKSFKSQSIKKNNYLIQQLSIQIQRSFLLFLFSLSYYKIFYYNNHGQKNTCQSMQVNFIYSLNFINSLNFLIIYFLNFTSIIPPKFVLQLMNSSHMIQESSQISDVQCSDSSNTKIKNKNNKTLKIKKKNTQITKNIQLTQNPSHSSSQSQSNKKTLPCINKICPKNKNLAAKYYQTKNYAFDPNQLCEECMVQYKKQAYCMYCKQIYFDSSDDGKQWILCDECKRWVHSQCANYDPNYDSQFKCIKCKKNHNSNTEPSLVKKQSIKPNSKLPDRRKQLAQCSLNAYGFYWQLGPKQLAQDMDKIRQYLN